jgi:hypothetical protein
VTSFASFQKLIIRKHWHFIGITTAATSCDEQRAHESQETEKKDWIFRLQFI